MSSQYSRISVRQLNEDENTPYDLLLPADPSKETIDSYLRHSKIFVATVTLNVIGAFVLFPLSDTSAEKDIAVKSELQSKGVNRVNGNRNISKQNAALSLVLNEPADSSDI